MENWLPDEETAMQIEQVGLFIEAVERITTSATQYDLVIFDINLKNGFADDISDQEKEKLEKTFESYHIPFKYSEVEKSLAGYLLYRLLLAVGYPLKRMLIFSGHESKETAQKALSGIVFDKNNFLPKEKGKVNIEKYFSREKYDYYRIRRLVYQACSYWISILTTELKKAKNIPFNKLYYSYDGNSISKEAVTVESFIEMLEHIKMLFPVTEPHSPEKIYYKAMQTAASFHEESAKIQKISKDNPHLKQYHSCIRNFRNWSAHNLMPTRLNGDQFALLFCIALRTYWYWDSDGKLGKEDKLLGYEELYGFNSREIIDSNRLGNRLLDLWEKVHRELENRGEITYYADLGSAIRQLGKSGYKPMDEFLFIPLYCPSKLISSPQVQYGKIQCKLKVESVDELCEKSKIDNAEGRFMKFCYGWIKEY